MKDLLNKVHCIDAMELLAKIPDSSIDMVLCDLPYGVTACKWDTVIPIEQMWKELKRVVKPRAAIVLTATQPFASRLVSSNYEMFRYEWVWQKEVGTNFLNAKKEPMRETESVLVFADSYTKYYPVLIDRKDKKRVKYSYKGKVAASGQHPYGAVNFEKTPANYFDTNLRYPSNIIKFNRETGLHATQKPVKLFEYLIKTYTQEGEIVLDMTVGSGTTAVAAMNTGRQFIVGDYLQEYVDIARTRLQNTNPFVHSINKDGTKQLSLFETLGS